MSGLIYGAMAGGGAALQKAGVQLGEHISRSTLQEEMAEIQKARDERLAELRKGEIEYADTLRRKPGMEAAKEIEAARTGVVDDLSGTMRARTPSEMAQAEEAAFRKQGLVSEAMQVRTTEMQRERDNKADLARTRDDNRADEQLEQTKKYQGASLSLQQEQLKASREGFVLQPTADGRIMKVFKDGRSDYLRDPGTGEAVSGGKNLPEATKLLVEVNKAIIVANERRMKDASTPEEQNAIAQENARLKAEIDTLLGAKPAAASKPGAAKHGERPPLASFFGFGGSKAKPAPAAQNASGGTSTASTPAPGSKAPSARQFDEAMEAKDPQLRALRVQVNSADPTISTHAWIRYAERLKQLQSGM